ncbi:hypothetical protein J6590_063231 [Homalodisca vitripennis]|nr:hypothetical protein J6590_063231 [Homalodisca vitripennis]
MQHSVYHFYGHNCAVSRKGKAWPKRFNGKRTLPQSFQQRTAEIMNACAEPLQSQAANSPTCQEHAGERGSHAHKSAHLGYNRSDMEIRGTRADCDVITDWTIGFNMNKTREGIFEDRIAQQSLIQAAATLEHCLIRLSRDNRCTRYSTPLTIGNVCKTESCYYEAPAHTVLLAYAMHRQVRLEH